MRIGNMMKNDKFMSALGIAFIISFLCGMTDMISKGYISGTISLVEGFADLFRNINACFYLSSLAVVMIEWLHSNERLNGLLKILTVLSLLIWLEATKQNKVVKLYSNLVSHCKVIEYTMHIRCIDRMLCG